MAHTQGTISWTDINGFKSLVSDKSGTDLLAYTRDDDGIHVINPDDKERLALCWNVCRDIDTKTLRVLSTALDLSSK